MVSMEQGELPEDRRVLRTLTEAAGGAFGVGAEVLRPGTIRVGDPVRVR
jgi:MOSC domain-containing protein YiiM